MIPLYRLRNLWHIIRGFRWQNARLFLGCLVVFFTAIAFVAPIHEFGHVTAGMIDGGQTAQYIWFNIYNSTGSAMPAANPTVDLGFGTIMGNGITSLIGVFLAWHGEMLVKRNNRMGMYMSAAAFAFASKTFCSLVFGADTQSLLRMGDWWVVSLFMILCIYAVGTTIPGLTKTYRQIKTDLLSSE